MYKTAPYYNIQETYMQLLQSTKTCLSDGTVANRLCTAWVDIGIVLH